MHAAPLHSKGPVIIDSRQILAGFEQVQVYSQAFSMERAGDACSSSSLNRRLLGASPGLTESKFVTLGVNPSYELTD